MRERLPNRRGSCVFEFECVGLLYRCSFSRFADGRLAEIFCESVKHGTHADIASRDAAIACSIALQHGANADELRLALCRDSHGAAQGPLATALDAILGGKAVQL
jgi:hypothetical protein